MSVESSARGRQWIDSIRSAFTAADITADLKRITKNGASRGCQPLADALARHLSPVIIDREQLQVICRRQGMLTYYGTSEVFEIDAPHPADEPMDSLDQRVGEHHIPQPFVGELPDVTLVGRYPMPFHERQLVLEAISHQYVALLNLCYTIAGGSRLKPTGRTRTLDRAVLLHNCWDYGYFHWMTEVLTRLEGVERYRERTGRRPTLILGPDPSPFQTESLELLGYDESDWVEWDGTTTTVEHLVVPSMRRAIRRGSVASPVACDWLRDRLRAPAVNRVDTDRFSRRVYISRADADRRRVVNERAVMELLSEYGFESYRLADMSVAENIALFSQADVVVGPHGAGLTDMMFADETSVVELLRGTDNTRVYFVLAQYLGHRYRHLQCEPTGVDLAVDLAELDAIVSEEVTTGTESKRTEPSRLPEMSHDD